jgi:hypothetical protein
MTARIAAIPAHAVILAAVRFLALALLILPAQDTGTPAASREARLDYGFVGAAALAPGPVLDLAFLGDSQVVALTTRELSLYRWTDQGLSLQASRPLPGSEEAVRWPGGLLHVVEEDHAVWALASTRNAAVLFTLQSGRLAERDTARALPWPRCRMGLRYRAGTNLLEGEVDGLGPGPFLTLDAVSAAGVAPDGRLLVAGSASGELRVGPALGPLWSRHLAASTAAPPGREDALLVLAREGSEVRAVSRVPMPGPVRALATRPREGRARAVAAISDGGETRLLALELAPLEP